MVTVTEVVRLSFVGLPRAPDASTRVFRLPDGGWGVSSAVFENVVQRFDSTGVAAGTFGHRGAGPGEFGGQVFGVTVGRELWVIDPANARLSAYSEDLVLVKSRPFPWRVFSVSLSRRGHRVLASGFFHSAGGSSRSVGRFSLDARADAFGGEVPDTPRIPRVQIQFAAATPGGEVWTVATMGGSVDVLRTADLSLVEQFRLPGVPTTEEISPRAPGRRSGDPPEPQVLGITADDRDGLLWVLIGVADPDWTPALDDDVDGIDSMFDTRVLAIDAATRTVVGEAVLDEVCLPVGSSLISCVNDFDQVIRVMALGLSTD